MSQLRGLSFGDCEGDRKLSAGSMLRPRAHFMPMQSSYLPDCLRASGHLRPTVGSLGTNKNTQQVAKLWEASAIGGEPENTGFTQ